MRLLLDTHLLLWVAEPSKRLSASARKLIEDPDNEPVFSAASIWEVAIKGSLDRKEFRADPRLLRRTLLNSGYLELLIDSEHGAAVIDLPAIHKDPFDRLLIAQSVVEGIVLLTHDPVVARYGGLVRAV
jgi:PIN domain nuclease of toxin-antitoxin system